MFWNLVNPGYGPIALNEGVGLGVIQSHFSGGKRGFAFTPWDLTTLFQDAAGTTPVTADGDPVGLMRDVSGNANHATSSGTKRPLLKISSGLYYLLFDSIDDCMQIASLALGTSQHEWLATLQNNGKQFFMEHSATSNAAPGHFFYGHIGSAWSIYRTSANSASAGAEANWADGTHVNERIYTAGSGGSFRRDGVARANGVINGSAQSESVVTDAYNIGSRNQASLFFGGRYYGHILSDGAADNAALYDLLRTKAGL